MEHSAGPFKGIKVGSTLRIMHEGVQVRLVLISKVNNYSLTGVDGAHDIKITRLPSGTMSMYTEIRANLISQIRPIGLEIIS